MKKRYLPILLILIIPGIYFIMFMEKPIAKVMNKPIFRKDIEVQADIVMLLDNIDQYSDDNALFDIIRHRIFIQLCDRYSIKRNREMLMAHKEMISAQMNGSHIMTELESLLGNDFNNKFLIPDYCNYAFVRFALNDTTEFQADRYNYAKEITAQWIGNEYKDILNEFSEYVEYSGNIVIDSNAVIMKIEDNILFDDVSYFYVLRQNSEMTYGIRVMKHSIEEIIMSIPADYQIEFYNEGYMRAVYKISTDSYWHSIIFHE